MENFWHYMVLLAALMFSVMHGGVHAASDKAALASMSVSKTAFDIRAANP